MYVPHCAELLCSPWLCTVTVQTVLCSTAACDRQRNLSACNTPYGAVVPLHIPVLLSYPKETLQKMWEHDFLGQYGVSSSPMHSPKHFKVMAVSVPEKNRWRWIENSAPLGWWEGIYFPSSPLTKTYDVVKCSISLSPVLHPSLTEVYFQAYLPVTCASNFKIGKLILNDIAQLKNTT